MEPNYVAKKSAVPALNPICILFCWLIVPLIIQIFWIIEARKSVIEFYDDKIVVKGGIFNTYEKQSVFMGVYSVSMSQTFFGRIFGYGNISVDSPGKWDVFSCGIKEPEALKNYLETKIITRGVQHFIMG